jgi:hypothetical protein
MGKLLKIVKLLKPGNFDIADISDTLEDIAQSKIVQMIYRRFGVFANMMLLCHWLACGMKLVDNGFLTQYQDVNGRIWAEYLAAIYWSMTTLTTVGYGDIIPTSDTERIYTTVSMVIGGGFYGYVVGAITSMVSNSDLNATAYYDRMDLIAAWISHHRLPASMRRSVRRYFKAYLTEKSALSEAAVWHDLSPELQKEIGDHILHEDVKANPLFDGMSMGCIVKLQSILQSVTVLAGHVITAKGEAGTAMYFIASGWHEMDCGPRDGSEMQTNGSAATQIEKAPLVDKDRFKKLGPGQSFGEEVLLGFTENYAYSITCTEKSKLEMILEDEFLMLWQAMPNVLERMRQNALELNPEWAQLSLTYLT